MFRSEPFDAKLVSARLLTPFVRELVLERQGGAPFNYLAGQWVNLVLPLEGGEVKRAYSVASAPVASSPRFEVAVTKVTGGAGSQYLHDLEIGATLRAIGPQGLFTRAADDASPALFVATGTGVTPLRAMLQAAISEVRVPLRLLFGARVESDILYREELEGWARDIPAFHYDITLSQPGPNWTGRRGYVQEHVPALPRRSAKRPPPRRRTSTSAASSAWSTQYATSPVRPSAWTEARSTPSDTISRRARARA